MQRNRAYRIHHYGGPDALRLDEIAIPSPDTGQVLVEVKAAGVNGLDWKVRQGLLKDMMPLMLPAVLGCELAGVAASTGAAAARFRVGDQIMGPIGFGAYADYIAVDEAKLCLIPDSLTDVQAAAIPVAALTAWQALRAAGELRRGQRILIHGAAGAVRGFAVQFAKGSGATVVATAAATSLDYVLGLGADEVIDYRAERFEERARKIDLVLDLVGGETLDRSWQVLAPEGAVISTAAPDIAGRTPRATVAVRFGSPRRMRSPRRYRTPSAEQVRRCLKSRSRPPLPRSFRVYRRFQHREDLTIIAGEI